MLAELSLGEHRNMYKVWKRKSEKTRLFLLVYQSSVEQMNSNFSCIYFQIMETFLMLEFLFLTFFEPKLSSCKLLVLCSEAFELF